MSPTAGSPTSPRSLRLVLGLTVLALVGLATLTAGYHLSAGASDAAGTAPAEHAGDPSVDGDLRDRGLARDCYAPNASDLDPRAAAASDAFCGRLVYERGTAYEQLGPPDQDLPSDRIGGFDVVYASYVGTYGIGTCAPWCFPGGEAVYRSAHDAGALAGLTPTGEEAYAGDQGWQTYGAALALANAPATLQRNTGAWEGDGWVQPTPDQTFVAFLEDDEGAPIGDDRLGAIVAADDGLPADALAAVCGFTPDADVATARPGADACEVPFAWQAGDGEEACASPTYACGALTAAWRAQVACGVAHCGSGPTEGGDRLGPAASANDYDVWHWVVAPTASACEGAQEPGFDVDPDQAAYPYLAHDLDVYTPLATAGGVQGSENLEALGLALAEEARSRLPATPASPGDEPGAATVIAKDHRVEPNAPGDTSQTHVEVDRTLAEDPCAELGETSEDPAYVDPWVDVTDAQVYRNLWLDSILGVDPWLEGVDRRTYQEPPTTAAFGDANDAYLTTDERQDASNRPGPWMYSAGGNVGVFADKDDDGRYDPAPNGRLLDGVEDTGAYPMFWDMRVDDQGSIATEAGCRLGGEERLTGAMAEAGYGPRTGLVMVVYKTEPGLLYEWRTSQTFLQPEGERAYVLLSQALHAQRDDLAVQATIAAALERLPVELAPDDERVVYPNAWIAPASDFYEQCGYPTGGFHTSWSFTHDAHARDGDTVATAYVFENVATDGVIGGNGTIPAFAPEGDPYAFPTGINRWIDVDPFDGEPARSTDTCSAPPHDGDRC